MTRNSLLKSIAQAGYNVGFGAKKHFITYDFHRVLPKLISFIVLFIGVFQLTEVFKKHISVEYSDYISIALILLALVALSVDFLGKNIERYNVSGKELLCLFNELRQIYNDAKECQDESKLVRYSELLIKIEKHYPSVSISEQAIFTHILTNVRFFSEMQIDWIDEQLHFTIKDKFPFYHPEAFLLYFLFMASIFFIVKSLWC